MSTSIGTAAAAKLFLAISTLPSPTVNTNANTIETPSSTRPWTISSTRKNESFLTTTGTAATSIANSGLLDVSSRETTSLEIIIGEIRKWALYEANWDSEGAEKPLISSIKEAVSFLRILNGIPEPEPMLLATGHTALFWNDKDTYADLEFLGDNRVAYFIKKNNDKHKGVVEFDSAHIPAVFKILLSA